MRGNQVEKESSHFLVQRYYYYTKMNLTKTQFDAQFYLKTDQTSIVQDQIQLHF